MAWSLVHGDVRVFFVGMRERTCEQRRWIANQDSSCPWLWCVELAMETRRGCACGITSNIGFDQVFAPDLVGARVGFRVGARVIGAGVGFKVRALVTGDRVGVRDGVCDAGVRDGARDGVRRGGEPDRGPVLVAQGMLDPLAPHGRGLRLLPLMADTVCTMKFPARVWTR